MLEKKKEMLILTRKVGEKIMIGNHITITVKKLKSGRVSLGIDAPPEIPVLRMELLTQKATRVPRELNPQP